MRSDVAIWHELSGLPDNVTAEGLIVGPIPGRQVSIEKDLLRSAIARLRASGAPDEARSLARLAAAYLLAGDMETAQRYVAAAEQVSADSCP